MMFMCTYTRVMDTQSAKIVCKLFE